jgi:hypothetical protein
LKVERRGENQQVKLGGGCRCWRRGGHGEQERKKNRGIGKRAGGVHNRRVRGTGGDRRAGGVCRTGWRDRRAGGVGEIGRQEE